MQRSQEIGVYKEAVSNTFRITYSTAEKGIRE